MRSGEPVARPYIFRRGFDKFHIKDFKYLTKALLTYDLSFHYCFSLRSLCSLWLKYFDAIALPNLEG